MRQRWGMCWSRMGKPGRCCVLLRPQALPVIVLDCTRVRLVHGNRCMHLRKLEVLFITILMRHMEKRRVALGLVGVDPPGSGVGAG